MKQIPLGMIQDLWFSGSALPSNYPKFLSQSDFQQNAKAFMSQISSHMTTPAAVLIGPCDLHPFNRLQAL